MNKDFGEIGEIDKTIGKYSFKRLFVRSRLFLANTISNNLLPKHFNAVLKLRAWVYRRIGGLAIGQGVRMYGGTYILGTKFSIGDNTFIGADCMFACSDNVAITIGKNCDISFDVCFICGTHEIGTKQQRAGKGLSKAICVKDGTWIGVRATVLGGVAIGRGSIIGASSLVNKDVPANAITGGVPAEILRELED